MLEGGPGRAGGGGPASLLSAQCRTLELQLEEALTRAQQAVRAVNASSSGLGQQQSAEGPAAGHSLALSSRQLQELATEGMQALKALDAAIQVRCNGGMLAEERAS